MRSYTDSSFLDHRSSRAASQSRLDDEPDRLGRDHVHSFEAEDSHDSEEVRTGSNQRVHVYAIVLVIGTHLVERVQLLDAGGEFIGLGRISFELLTNISDNGVDG